MQIRSFGSTRVRGPTGDHYSEYNIIGIGLRDDENISVSRHLVPFCSVLTMTWTSLI